jgi:signal transduction histidine kinase
VRRILTHISSSTKIAFAGLALVLIPILILSYYGFTAMTEKVGHLQSNYQSTASFLRNKIENEVTKSENDFRTAFLDTRFDYADEKQLQETLRHLCKIYPLISYPFLLRTNNSLSSLHVFIRWQTRKHRDTNFNSLLREDLKFAEKTELSSKNIQEAVRLYQRAFISTASPHDQCLILSRIGRCYFKMQKYKEGIEAYRQILLFDTKSINDEGVPISVIALSQIVEGFEAIRTNQESEKAAIELYSSLVEHPWDLEDGSYFYYLELVHTYLNKFKSFNPKLIDLAKQEEIIRGESRFLQFIQQNCAHIITAELAASEADDRSPRYWPSLYNGQSVFLRFIPVPSASEYLVLGYEIDQKYFLSIRFGEIIHSSDLGRQFIPVILNEKDSIIYKQERVVSLHPLMVEQCSSVLPGWKIAFFDRSGKTIDDITAAEKRYYIILFLGTVILMACGIGITIRSAAHEIQMVHMKSEFVSNVTHELKTPLTLIRMFSETLESGYVIDEAKRKEFSGIIRRESERLTHLIDNVLDFSKMEAEKKEYQFEEVDVAELVHVTLDSYSYQIQQQGFHLDISLPESSLYIHADRNAIQQCILNLISNALKYFENEKYIGVSLLKNDNHVSLSVTDRGMGIAKEELTKVFEQLFRSSQHKDKAIRGTGLGLTLTKKIIEAHKGTIDVHSQLHEGSTFTITLPLLKTINRP